MKKSNKFSPEVRERAGRMGQEHRAEYPSPWAAVESIAPKIGCVPKTLLDWVQQQEVDSGVRAGVTTAKARRVQELEQAVELATLEWVAWFNYQGLLGPLGYIPPAQAEANYHRQLANQVAAVA